MNIRSYSVVFNGADPEAAFSAAMEGNHSLWAAASGDTEQAAPQVIRILEEEAAAGQQVTRTDLETCFEQMNPFLTEARAEVSLAGVIINGSEAQLFSVGNARALRFSRGTLVMHSDDHTEAYEKLFDKSRDDPKEYNELRCRAESRELKRALGRRDNFLPQFYPAFKLKPDDALVLCTEGFWRYLSTMEMELDYRKSAGPEEWLRIMARRVMMKAGKRLDDSSFAVTAIMTE